MSSEDQVRPFHAKEEARGQEAADAVAAVLKHAAEKEKVAHAKPAPKKQPRWLLPVGVNLAVLALYLLLAPPRWVVVNPIEGPDMAAQAQNLKVALYFQAQAIESYKQQNGSLPTTLGDLTGYGPSFAAQVEYVRQGEQQYQLLAFVGEEPLVWDSSGPNTDIIQAATAAAQRIGG